MERKAQSKKLDYKKEFPDLYLPKKKPVLIEVPKMTFIMVKGKGNPNTSAAYADALSLLYGLSFGIKMNLKFDKVPGDIRKGMCMEEGSPVSEGNYTVPPLEGLWWTEDKQTAFDGRKLVNKEELRWFSMIRQPDEVTEELFAWAKAELGKKKPELDTSAAKLLTYEEGLCAQLLHVGPYDDEPASIEVLERFIEEQGFEGDFRMEEGNVQKGRYHHEIYLGDPRRTAPERLKTVVRHPVKKKN
ncbi:MAG: transcriptional regulator [Lachnospiraceae bacterium]|jgi:hypothetical protein|nr:transcriptional regulator [Lachnospiraceae bacterium]